MRLPYETRGTILTASGTKRLSTVKRTAIGEETWEVLSRLASALECEPTPETFDELSRTAMRAVEKCPGSIVRAGVTPAGTARAIDRRLAELDI
jgi:hypothetical protein